MENKKKYDQHKQHRYANIFYYQISTHMLAFAVKKKESFQIFLTFIIIFELGWRFVKEFFSFLLQKQTQIIMIYYQRMNSQHGHVLCVLAISTMYLKYISSS